MQASGAALGVLFFLIMLPAGCTDSIKEVKDWKIRRYRFTAPMVYVNTGPKEQTDTRSWAIGRQLMTAKQAKKKAEPSRYRDGRQGLVRIPEGMVFTATGKYTVQPGLFSKIRGGMPLLIMRDGSGRESFAREKTVHHYGSPLSNR